MFLVPIWSHAPTWIGSEKHIPHIPPEAVYIVLSRNTQFYAESDGNMIVCIPLDNKWSWYLSGVMPPLELEVENIPISHLKPYTVLSRSTYFCMLQLASDVNMIVYQTLDNIRSYITYLGSYPRLNLGVGSMFQTVHQKPTTFPFRLLNYINLIISYLCGNNASQRLCKVGLSIICGKYTSQRLWMG